MKLLNVLTITGLVALFAQSQAATTKVVEKINEAPAFTYIPFGFDDNDIVQVMIEGQFSNSCYKVGQAENEVTVDKENKRVVINNEIIYTPYEMCLQMLVNYQKLIKIGKDIPIGDYEIVYNVGDKSLSQGTLNIAKAKKIAIDDYLYLPVEQAYFLREIENVRPPTMVLTGKFTNTCQRPADYDLQMEKSPRVITILPKMEQVGEDCKNEDRPFELKIPLTDLRKKERYLVHIRSLDGQAINRIIEVY